VISLELAKKREIKSLKLDFFKLIFY